MNDNNSQNSTSLQVPGGGFSIISQVSQPHHVQTQFSQQLHPDNSISSNAFQDSVNVSQRTGGIPLSISLLSPNNQPIQKNLSPNNNSSTQVHNQQQQQQLQNNQQIYLTPNQTSGKQNLGQQQNRIGSNKNLRDNTKQLKDYGMSIITGGPGASSSQKPQQHVQQSYGGIPQTQSSFQNERQSVTDSTSGKQKLIKKQQFPDQSDNQQYLNTQSSNNRKNSGLDQDYSGLQEMIEVKKTNNYHQLGKSTLNQRLGEDYEPDKPIISYNKNNQQQNDHANSSAFSPGVTSSSGIAAANIENISVNSRSKSMQKNQGTYISRQNQQLGMVEEELDPNEQNQGITEERLQEIKLAHYSRKAKVAATDNSLTRQNQGTPSNPEKFIKNINNQQIKLTGQYPQQINIIRSPEKQIAIDNYTAALQKNLESGTLTTVASNQSYPKANKKQRSTNPQKNVINQYQQALIHQQTNGLTSYSATVQPGQILEGKPFGSQLEEFKNDPDNTVGSFGMSSHVSQDAQSDSIPVNHLMNRNKQAALRRQQIVVNTNHCRSELDTIQYVIGKNGYRETNQPGDGTVLWYGMALRDHDLDIIKMRKCIFNRYPLMDHFAKKNIFCVIISRLQRFFPVDYKFMPDSFLLPDEIRDFEQHMRKFPGQTFIAKPSKGRGGDGIILLKKFTDLPKSAFHNEYLVQRYLDNPLLIDKKKFDCRLYVLMRGIDPVEAYLCDEGLARFCTHNYKKPDTNNIKDIYMHLTNFSVNKNSLRYKAPGEQFFEDDKSSKQLFTTAIKKLISQGKDVRIIMKQVKDIAQKTVIALEPYLKNAYHCFISTNHQNPRSFQILGLDLLIDEQLNCWLLEVNANPSLNVYSDKELPNGDIEQTLSELDKYVKTTLVSDCIKVVSTPADQIRQIQEVGSLKKILPVQDSQFEELYLYSYAEKMFEILAGQKSYDFITSNQFQRLSKYPGLTNNHILKAHYDIIYKNVVRRSDNNQMDLNCFFEALEELANRLFNHQDPFDNLQEVIEIIKKHVTPHHH